MCRLGFKPLECIGLPDCGGETYLAMQNGLYDRWAALTRQNGDSSCRYAGTDVPPYQLGRPSL